MRLLKHRRIFTVLASVGLCIYFFSHFILLEMPTPALNTKQVVIRDEHFVKPSLISIVAVKEANESSPISAFRALGFANTSIMMRQEVAREDFRFLTTPPNITCNDKSYQTKVRWSIIVFVKSNIKSIGRRNLIRSTWGAKKDRFKVRLAVVFVLGTTSETTNQDVAEENRRNGDLLQINVTEAYRNIGYKVLAGMQWAKERCDDHWIYASADDDMVPNLERVYKEIQAEMEQHSGYSPIICNFILRGNSPSRDIKTKNYVSEEYYSKDAYPKFCSGGFYSMSVSLANAIFETSRFHKYFYNDDVWLTALLRLSAVDAGLVHCRNITNDLCALSELPGGSVEHANGNDNILRRKLIKQYY